ncbi:hypothetical protein FVE85_3057 [Porphyridium purpureum]|uniref:GOLD domain-containing protein n=1 Tax=Porphyridium purpureum TaxID=35688 RepID=A0A5J4YTY0_PORPP|nr:hypothetical protein FVE85_3057 [Porphyridium purpureum]|eukprot:POR9492..scf227_4
MLVLVVWSLGTQAFELEVRRVSVQCVMERVPKGSVLRVQHALVRGVDEVLNRVYVVADNVNASVGEGGGLESARSGLSQTAQSGSGPVSGSEPAVEEDNASTSGESEDPVGKGSGPGSRARSPLPSSASTPSALALVDAVLSRTPQLLQFESHQTATYQICFAAGGSSIRASVRMRVVSAEELAAEKIHATTAASGDALQVLYDDFPDSKEAGVNLPSRESLAVAYEYLADMMDEIEKVQSENEKRRLVLETTDLHRRRVAGQALAAYVVTIVGAAATACWQLYVLWRGLYARRLFEVLKSS